MDRFRKYARIFWMIVVIATVSGPSLHDWAENSCAEVHATECESSEADCPAGHAHCGHLHAALAVLEAEVFSIYRPAAGVLLLSDETSCEGSLREIDHPPQLG